MLRNEDIRRIVRNVIKEEFNNPKQQAFADMRQAWEEENPYITDDDYEFDGSAEDGHSNFLMDRYKSSSRMMKKWNDMDKINQRAPILHSRDHRCYERMRHDQNERRLEDKPNMTAFDDFHDGLGFDD